MHARNRLSAIWPVSLARIENVVSAPLGPGRVRGNVQGPCFSRQISLYLAKRVGRWSLSQIGRFYNGRHHTTVLHAIEKIERLRGTDEAVDALVDVLTAALSPESTCVAADGMRLKTASSSLSGAFKSNGSDTREPTRSTV